MACVLIERVRPPHKTGTWRKSHHCFSRSWITAQRGEGLDAALDGCFVCQLPHQLLLTSGRLSAQYRFKILSVNVCNELGIHSTDVSFKKQINNKQPATLFCSTSPFSDSPFKETGSNPLGVVLFLSRVPAGACSALHSPPCYLPALLHKSKAKISERQISQSHSRQNSVSLFLSE